MEEQDPLPREVDARGEALRGCVLTIGNFDGVHLGHQRLLQECRRWAAEQLVPVVTMTFEPHPIQILRPAAAPQRLTTAKEKIELLRRFGADHVIVLATDEWLLNLEAEEFLLSEVIAKLAPTHLIEGDNFRFGKGRQGDVAFLQGASARHGFALHVVEPVTVALSWPPIQQSGATAAAREKSDVRVSSSLVRDLLVAGQVEAAAMALGRPYVVTGIVVSGQRRGRELGFPTANLHPDPLLVPASAVYSGVAEVSGDRYAAAISIGNAPTFDGVSLQVEAHLLGFSGDLYDAAIRLEFHRRLREQRRFSSIAMLIEQLNRDVAEVASETSTLLKF